MVTKRSPGPATDYSSAMANWVLNRRPESDRGPLGFEVERPSPSYIIDVRVISISYRATF